MTRALILQRCSLVLAPRYLQSVTSESRKIERVQAGEEVIVR